jgi:hypothetical protein
MTYRLLLYYPGEDLFFPTNHTSDDVDALWQLAARDLYRGCLTRIVDEAGVVVCEPPIRCRVIDPTNPGPAVRAIWTGEQDAELGAPTDRGRNAGPGR